MLYISRITRQPKQIEGDMDSVEKEHLEGEKRRRIEKDLEKTKDNKFGKLLSEQLKWLKCSLQQGKRFRMKSEKLAGMNHIEPWKPL